MNEHLVFIQTQQCCDIIINKSVFLVVPQIKEKLKEHGMAENATVKWIEKPGGVVFHKEEGHNNDTENESEESCDV